MFVAYAGRTFPLPKFYGHITIFATRRPSSTYCARTRPRHTLAYLIKRCADGTVANLGLATDLWSISGRVTERNTSKLCGQAGITHFSRSNRKYPPDMTPCPQFGLWYDFVEGVGGGPLSAIQKARNVGYLEAVEIGAEITGLSMSELAAHVPDPKLVDHHGRERTKMSGRFGQSTSDDSRLAEARRIWASSIALPGTLASEYLVKHRKIDPGVIERLHFGFLPKYPFISDLEELQSNEEYGGKPIMGPALLVPVRNSDWHLTGVQRIFLNEDTAGKPKGQHKFSKGHLKGNAGIVQRGGGSGSIVYVVEGPETGASVACAVNPDATIVATLSLGNLANIGNFVRSLKPLKVVLALDHDVKEAAKNAMERATSVLAKELEKDDISWERRLPELTARGSALDWNDILVTQGLDELKRQLGT